MDLEICKLDGNTILRLMIKKLFPFTGQRLINKFLFLFLFLPVCFIYLAKVGESSFIQDDAFTSLRYVKNFLNGDGLVFNYGERVEGYTNFLWVMLLSAITYATQLISRVPVIAHALNLNPLLDLNTFLPSLAQFLSNAFGITALLITYILSRRLIGKKYNPVLTELFSFIPAATLLYSTNFVYWSVSGMETSLFVSLTLLSIYYFLDPDPGRRKWFLVVSILNTFLRPEGMIFFFLLLCFEYLENFINHKENKPWKRIIKSIDKKLVQAIIIYSIPVAAYICFRLVYYGYPFPNTFYAKTEFTIQFLKRGSGYFFDFLKAYLLYGIILLPVILQLLRGKLKREEILLIFFSASWCLIVILLGGDILPIHRFFIPVLPLIYLVALISLLNLIDELKAKHSQVIAYIILIIFSLALAFNGYERNKGEMMEKRAYETGLVTKMKIYADYLNKVEKKNSRKVRVAMSTIGAFSFYSGLPVIDLVGLTDEYIAHNPKEEKGIDEELPVLWKERHYNTGYILSQKPDYIIFPAGGKPSAFAECALFVQNEFYKNYYMKIFYSKQLNQLLPVFTRRENIHVSGTVCDNRFVKYYIEANNLFLKMLETKNGKLSVKIFSLLDKMVSICPARNNDALTLKGMVYFHIKNNILAEEFFREAVKHDPANSLANFYLMNIFISGGNESKAYGIIPRIAVYSPHAVPYLEPE